MSQKQTRPNVRMCDFPKLVELARRIAFGTSVPDDVVNRAITSAGVTRQKFDDVVAALR